MIGRYSLVFAAAVALAACAPKDGPDPQPTGTLASGPASQSALAKAPGSGPAEADPAAPTKKVVQPPVAAEKAPTASPTLEVPADLKDLLDKTESHFKGANSRRIYVQVDKPLYKPGETVWIKTWDLKLRGLDAGQANGINYELVSPKGAVVRSKRVRQQGGTATNDFEIPAGVPGGEYIIRAKAFDGVTGERKIIVSAYEPPRIKKTLEFVRKAYGAGDEVKATIEVKRPTGEPLGDHPLRALVTLDGQQLPPVALKTNADGGGLVKFTLPAQIAKGDALLTVLVDDGGVTESISKRVPIILKKLKFSLFPEGGHMVEGLPGRVYFEAKTLIDKPADVEGEIVDDQGQSVARFKTYKNGLGKFGFTPATGRTYKAKILKPVGVTEQYALPLARQAGCVLRHFDDPDGQVAELRVSVRCTEAQTVFVLATVREQLFDSAAVQVPADGAAVVHLKAKDAAQTKARGIARVTVFSEKREPLAERLVFRNRRGGLQVKITPDQAAYVPREQVALTVQTTTADGEPVPAELALSVVDDTVISFADDKKGHLLSQVLLEPDLPGKIEEPKFFFDLKEKKSAVALDLLMGTRGYRKFEWRPVINPPPPRTAALAALGGADGVAFGAAGLGMRGVGRGGGGMPRGRIGGIGKLAARGKGGRPRPMRRARRPVPAKVALAPVAAAKPKPKPAPQADKKPMAPPAPPPAVPAQAMAEAMPAELALADEGDREEEPPPFPAAVGRKEAKREIAMNKDADWDRRDDLAGREKAKKRVAWAKVRVFPAPTYDATYDGPRTDFRETVHWAPTVKTGKDGKATVTFYLSDAVTSFRVFAEGTGGGALGRKEQVFKSNLPFSMAVKLPLQVSQGDTLELPLTLSNEQAEALPVSLSASFGDLLRLDKPVTLDKPALDPKARASLFYPVTVTGTKGKSKVMFSANAGGLKDEFVREVVVSPRGFPQLQEAAGTLADTAELGFDIGDAAPDAVTATLKFYPSPVSTLVGGLEGLIRQPSGCFEQTSSSNYPNVMVLQYLQSNDVADPALVARTNKFIDRGYNKLVSFETKAKGYEWFGHSPPHEALTAYGVLEFIDMQNVYGGVDKAMIERTVAWLKGRRDGKGGFQRNSRALDSFGRAKPEVTDAYITYAVTEAGLGDQFGPEVARQAKAAQASKDAYLLALATNTLLNLPGKAAEADAALARLAAMQGDDGAWTTADHSITRSTGKNLHIETTALAALALMERPKYAANVRNAVEWMSKNRSGFGRWGATQATVLALKAMTEYTVRNRATPSDGSLKIVVNGKVAEQFNYKAGRREPIVFTGLGKHFKPGKNSIQVQHTGSGQLPYSMAVEYVAMNPATHPQAPIAVQTKLATDTLKMGENVRLTTTVKNTTQEGQPMTLARVGLPGGLTFQNWQLKELVEKKQIAFFETGPREVILYFRQMKPGETREIPLDLVALVPGQFEGPASSAYLYYTDDKKHWAKGLKVRVNR